MGFSIFILGWLVFGGLIINFFFSFVGLWISFFLGFLVFLEWCFSLFCCECVVDVNVKLVCNWFGLGGFLLVVDIDIWWRFDIVRRYS